MSDYIFTLSGVIVGVLFVLLLAFVFSFQGCAIHPRESSMCLKSGFWVKCPKVVPVGTDITNFKKDKKCKKKACVNLKNQISRLNSELEKSEKRIITPLGAFFGFLALFAIVTLIFIGLGK